MFDSSHPSADMPSLDSSPTHPPEWASAPIAPRMGRYVLGPELGRGGMGRVFEAWDPLLNRRVALKILNGSDPEPMLKLMQEAQSQARIEHPHIVRIFEMGVEESYIAMQRVQGRPLNELRPDLDFPAMARILADVASAVHAAHLQGLIHRDLKPQNILVECRREGEFWPYVVDFGLARDLDLQDQTLSWALVGTPAFMSPEQAQAQPPSVAGDIYSLGATLYALLTGVPPYEVSTLTGLVTQQMLGDAPPARKRNPAVPRDLETIALKCLELEPSRRYTSAFELEADLRRFLAGEPILARPVRAPERAWRWILRHRALSTTAASAVLISSLLLGWNLHQRTVAQKQVELAQRFGMAVREIEDYLRIERMLPPHDLRPAEAEVRKKLDVIRASMQQLGSQAEGPGSYALGRGYLALRDYKRAVAELKRAWDLGYQSGDCAYALGMAYAGLLSRAYFHLQPLPAGAERTRVEEEQDRLYRQPALAFFRQAQASNLESAPLAQARMAFLEKRFADCIPLCQVAFKAQFSCYEALLLEAEAHNQLLEIDTDRGKPLEALSMGKVNALLQQAQAIARSDVDLLKAMNHLTRKEAVQASEAGQPNLDIFVEARQRFRMAQQILPPAAGDLEAYFGLCQREGFVRLAAGEDAREHFRACLKEVAQAAAQNPEKYPFDAERLIYHWLLAEAQWRRGEDPRPSVARGLASSQRISLDRAEILGIQARYEAQHGLDLLASLRQAELEMARCEKDGQGSFYLYVLWGELRLIRAQWESWTGQNPLASIQEGVAKLKQSLEIRSTCVYAYFHLPLLHALEAHWRMKQGQDAGGAVLAALKAAQAGLKIRNNHFRMHLAHGEALRAQACWQKSQGQDPHPALREARKAMERGRACNPTDWRLFFARAQVELMTATLAREAGGDPGPAMLEARRQAQAGLRIKADATELKWVLEQTGLGSQTMQASSHTHKHQAR